MADTPEKEILNSLFNDTEKYPVTERKEPEIDKENASYIQKVEQEIYLSKPITDDAGQPMVSSQVLPTPTIILPTTKQKYLDGLKQKVVDSVRWLAEWCGRLLKIFGAKATFKDTEAGK